MTVNEEQVHMDHEKNACVWCGIYCLTEQTQIAMSLQWNVSFV